MDVGALFVAADDPRHRDTADLANEDKVQQAVLHVGLGRGHITAAVGFAVADGKHQEFAGDDLAVRLHPQAVAQRAADGLHDGEVVGHRAAAEGQPAEFGDAVGHLSVQPGGADGRGDALFGLYQVDVHGRAAHHPLKVEEWLSAAEVANEVVAAAAGDAAHRRVGAPPNAPQHLVEGAVASAGVQPHLLPCLGLLGGQFHGMARVFGEQYLVVRAKLLCRVDDLRHQRAAGVRFAGNGVDDEHVPHFQRPLSHSIFGPSGMTQAGV